MSRSSKNLQRLYVNSALVAGSHIDCSKEQANYLLNVLRLRVGDEILLFNGRDGEWRASVVEGGKKSCRLNAGTQLRAQTEASGLTYIFAPLKRARLDYMVQKATEMGASRLMPVRTEFTQVSRVNLERMRANVIEAAEQCGVLSLPEVDDYQDLAEALGKRDASMPLVFCDEGAPDSNPLQRLRECRGPTAGVLIGPEGGFSDAERNFILGLENVVPVSLGSRIMRADTAAVAAMALVNATILA